MKCTQIKCSLLGSEISTAVYVTENTEDSSLLRLFSLYYELWNNILDELSI